MRFRCQHGVFLLATLAARAAAAGDPAGGGLVGWVESTQGVPVSGAVVSLFGRGIRGGSLVTLTDSSGQFALPSLPAGSYTLRAIGNGHQPAAARRVTVLPNQESLFTVSLAPEGEQPAATVSSDSDEDSRASVSPREWRWLVRHRRRSVLEASDHSAAAVPVVASAAPPMPDRRFADLAGSLEFLSAPLVLASGTEAPSLDGGSSMGAVKLGGHFEDGGTWNLGGLLAESTTATWRVAAEFVVEPAEGHELEAGAGFGTRELRGTAEPEASPLDTRSLGAIFVRDNWTPNDRLGAALGVRYSFVGFITDHNYVDPFASVSVRPDHETVLRGSVSSHTLAPGGDLLTVATLSSAPELALARLDERVRAERALRIDVSAERRLGSATTVGAFSFYEDVRDQMANAYEGDTRARVLRISNIGAVLVRGIGVTASRRLGSNVQTSVSYTYGQSDRDAATEGGLGVGTSFRVARFHDLVARVETMIDATDTRLAAYCRLNSLRSADGDPRAPHSSLLTTRFDVQLTQGLPFLQSLTRAEWEVLLSVRNLSYETSEAGTLDELAVLRPPNRVLGGVSVRF
jgi:Carboxypeptidase regulatory-like domain/TonB dependent receptor-like, beta-barrel